MGGLGLEAVGSVSWGGEVPQSDVDLTVLTWHGAVQGKAAVPLLRCLQQTLQRHAGIDYRIVHIGIGTFVDAG